MRFRRMSLYATVAAAGLSLAWSPAATAEPGHLRSSGPTVRVLNDGVIAPFQLAVHDDDVYVADGGTSLVSRLHHGALSTVAQGPQPGEVAGVALTRNGRTVAYTSSDGTTHETALTILRKGRSPVTADLSGYEAKKNPDGHRSYGIKNPSQCVVDAFAKLGGPPASYKGIVDSHPYSVTSLKDDSWAVADAAGNDILKVSSTGKVSLVAVLPSQPLKITQEIARSQNLPDCVVGLTYRFEPVPTDVEVGRDGWLYVSTLPGGPEDPSLGARGKVYKVNPWSGRVKEVAHGFSGATNLAIDKWGRIYVAELFAGQISTIKDGEPRKYVTLGGVVSVEWGDDHLYAGTLAPFDDQGVPQGHGSIVRIDR
jgi:hypothetical protein